MTALLLAIGLATITFLFVIYPCCKASGRQALIEETEVDRLRQRGGL